MTLNVGDSIPVEVPEAHGPRRLELGKARPTRLNPALLVWGLAWKWALPCFFIYVFFVLFWPAAALCSLVHAALMSRRRRWRRGLISLAVCPLIVVPLFSFAEGLLDYADASARRRSHGHRTERGSLDPLTRTFPTSSGCIVFGYEPFVEAPYNQALGLMVKSFGALRGHHSGAYPSKAEALAALKDGQVEVWNLEEKVRGFDDEAFGAWLSVRLNLPGLKPFRAYELYQAHLDSRCDHTSDTARRWSVRIREGDDIVYFGDERLVLMASKSAREVFAIYRNPFCEDE